MNDSTVGEHTSGRRESVGRLLPWALTAGCLALAAGLLPFAIVKVIPLQFARNTLPTWQTRQVGDLSKEDVLWQFMATSTTYTVMAGCIELVAVVLLLFARTAGVGAVVAVASLGQVVVLDALYEMPALPVAVALFVLALAVAPPWVRPLVRVLVVARDPASSNVRSVVSPRALPVVANVAVVVVFACAGTIFGAITLGNYSDQTRAQSPIDGVWTRAGATPVGVDTVVRVAIDDRPAAHTVRLTYPERVDEFDFVDVGGQRFRLCADRRCTALVMEVDSSDTLHINTPLGPVDSFVRVPG